MITVKKVMHQYFEIKFKIFFIYPLLIIQLRITGKIVLPDTDSQPPKIKSL